jgi:hypothetical protein
MYLYDVINTYLAQLFLTPFLDLWTFKTPIILRNKIDLCIIFFIYLNKMNDFIDCVKNNRVKQGTWHNTTNHKLYATWLGKKLGYEKIEDWYQISSETINKYYGSGLIKCYQGSPSLFLKSVFPEYNWFEWKFKQVSQHFWKNIENHKLYANWLGEILGYEKLEDWYNISTEKICQNNGGGLLTRHYDGSPYKFLQSVLPYYKWLGWKFIITPYHFWNIETEKLYTIWLGEKLGYKNIDDWYNITRDLLINNFGGGYILKKYNGSPSKFVMSVFSEYDWLEWKFLVTQFHFWENVQNQIKYTNWLGKILGYETLEDWYNLRVELFKLNYGYTLIINYYNGSPYKFLKSLFPEYEWIKSKFPKKYSIGQIEWLEYIKILTPDIRHEINNSAGEFKIPNSNYKADGYSKMNNCIYEYHGDFWHGNPRIFNSSDMNVCVNKTYGELYDMTLKKKYFCEKEGFKYKYIWESEWIRGKKALIILQKKIKSKFNNTFKKG